jgi:hypothetical protein
MNDPLNLREKLMYTNGSLVVEEATRRSVKRWSKVKGPHTSVYVKAGMIMLYLDDSRPPRGYDCVPAEEWLEAGKSEDFVTL